MPLQRHLPCLTGALTAVARQIFFEPSRTWERVCNDSFATTDDLKQCVDTAWSVQRFARSCLNLVSVSAGRLTDRLAGMKQEGYGHHFLDCAHFIDKWDTTLAVRSIPTSRSSN